MTDKTPKKVQDACKHRTTMKAAGLKVCFDCGEPLNATTRSLVASQKARRTTDGEEG